LWDVRYRPTRFADVLGQEGTVKVLQSRLRKGTGLDTSFIFSGGHGRGKTTLARLLGRALLCQDLTEDCEPCNECDNCQAVLTETSQAFFEMDAASKGTIDNIRRIVDDLSFVVAGATKRIYVFDESHRMSRDAQDVLLKPLEDKRMVGIFCTTEPGKIRGTIRSRCEEYPVRKITREDIQKRMQGILKQEGVEYEDDALLTIIDHSGGHVRDVLNRLEMIAQLGNVDLETVREYLNLSVVSTYYKVLLSLGRPAEAVPMVEDACDRVGADEVLAGLAEAAMNSYRLANGLFAEFIYVDRELAGQVHAMYGDGIVQLAQFFLQSPKSKIGLVCDVVRCAGGVPSPASAVGQAPPVSVQVSGPPAAASPPAESSPAAPESLLEATEVQPTPVDPPKAAEASEPSPAPVESPPAPPSAKKAPVDGDSRSDGIGNVGGADKLAHTSIDAKTVPQERPRGADPERKDTKFKGANGRQQQDALTPEQWSSEFEVAWTQRSGAM